MTRDEIIARLRENEASLRARGVAHAALFGSRARGDERADSDTDILIEFDGGALATIYDYVALKDHIARLFDGPVDVVDRDGLKPHAGRLSPTRSMPSDPEASHRLPDALKARHPAIAWKEMAAAGNVYRHEYEGVAARRVWQTPRLALPPSRVVVESELAVLP